MQDRGQIVGVCLVKNSRFDCAPCIQTSAGLLSLSDEACPLNRWGEKRHGCRKVYQCTLQFAHPVIHPLCLLHPVHDGGRNRELGIRVLLDYLDGVEEAIQAVEGEL